MSRDRGRISGASDHVSAVGTMKAENRFETKVKPGDATIPECLGTIAEILSNMQTSNLNCGVKKTGTLSEKV